MEHANSLLQNSLIIIVIMVSLGVLFGFILAYANKKLAIEVNPLIHIVEDVLPKGQCGACGYPGCMAYAEAVVTNPDVPPNLCTPGKATVAKLVGELTGKSAPPMEPKIAQVMCRGTHDKVTKDFAYVGVTDCHAANMIFGGPKSCKYSCLGLGTCVQACPFNAISMAADGLPFINPDKCTGCMKCTIVCPKSVMAMVPVASEVTINCNSKAKGPEVRKVCKVGCIACGICVKTCSVSAITVENNLARIDYSVCTNCGACVAKCPMKTINRCTETEACQASAHQASA
jgi:Na+-translocating ferredoxin:NAD+ oxidoreductase subunit B